MVPEKEWRDDGQNMDKRTARKVHAAAFKKTIRDIKKQYLQEQGYREDPETTELPSDQIHVYVRKRPLLPHELNKHEFDVISSIGDREIVIHECKMYNDMRHKFIVSHHQRFSRCYDETVDTETVYRDAGKPLVLHAMEGGKAVCMMYGQTGSGKTYTMSGMFQYVSEDLFMEAVGDVDFKVSVSAIEIVGSKCFDLMRDHAKVTVCDDGSGDVKLLNCSETEADSSNALYDLLEEVKALRTTEATDVNSQSSRSHLVVYINLRRCQSRAASDVSELYGQLVLLDLAGSERNEDSFYHDAARRKETIEINKSHLALKECIRAIGSEDTTGFRKGEFAKYAGNISTALDGRMLTRFTVARFAQICDGNAIDAGHLFKALRVEMAAHEKMMKTRREHKAARQTRDKAHRF
ncbi:hypothetical protein ATCC90586_003509 [Pythium insidiosum]|nr:hypothetical protein ATCC90586_003509 [Pythium insidiosum]